MDQSNMPTSTLLVPQNKYKQLIASAERLPDQEKLLTLRHLARTNLYFLIRYLFNRADFDHPWLYDRCNEVQENPYGYLDLWARDHRKSTIITYGHSIFEILRSHGENPYDPEEVTIGIFSHTRPIAKSFLRQIKRELESNKTLQALFPDILYENPDRDAATWSEDGGLILKRKNNPKEATVEAHGLVDGQPVGKHFNRLVYDDVVTLKSVASHEQIQKTTDAWALSLNLGTEDGKVKYIGTRYHFSDTYRDVMDREAAIPRIHAGTKEGTLDGTPVMLSDEAWRKKCREMGNFVASCQLLQNPKPDSSGGFQERDLQFYHGELSHTHMNRYILVDPANVKSKKSDYTAMIVVGLAPDENYYILSMYKDKMSLTERTDLLFKLHQKYRPLGVYYERYGMQADVQHVVYVQNQRNYRFGVMEFGGNVSKHDRIRRLLPITESNRLYLPATQFRTNWEGQTVDLVDRFIEEEFKAFPIIRDHDDMLDIMSRIADPDLAFVWPRTPEPQQDNDAYAPSRRTGGSWMSR